MLQMLILMITLRSKGFILEFVAYAEISNWDNILVPYPNHCKHRIGLAPSERRQVEKPPEVPRAKVRERRREATQCRVHDADNERNQRSTRNHERHTLHIQEYMKRCVCKKYALKRQRDMVWETVCRNVLAKVTSTS